MRILVADDAELIRRHIVTALAELNPQTKIAEAQEGAAAIQAFRKMRPDLVVLDVQMPKGDGLEILEQIKREAPGTIAIMFTHLDSAPYRRRFQAAGADHFITKNGGFQRLIKIIKKLSAKFPDGPRDR